MEGFELCEVEARAKANKPGASRCAVDVIRDACCEKSLEGRGVQDEEDSKSCRGDLFCCETGRETQFAESSDLCVAPVSQEGSSR